MEGIQTIQALKAVQSSLPAQTTIPSDELVMLYATDGTPIAKISRDDLVKAVASVMASNSQNTFSKLLGVQANGTPMGIGASDLASVLGVAKAITLENNEQFRVGDKAMLLFIGNAGTKKAAIFLCPYFNAAMKVAGDDFFGTSNEAQVQILFTTSPAWGYYIKNNSGTSITLTLGILG